MAKFSHVGHTFHHNAWWKNARNRGPNQDSQPDEFFTDSNWQIGNHSSAWPAFNALDVNDTSNVLSGNRHTGHSGHWKSAAQNSPAAAHDEANGSSAGGGKIENASTTTTSPLQTDSIAQGAASGDPDVLVKGAGVEQFGANAQDLLYVIPPGADLKVDLSDALSNAEFSNAVGYYFADASGKPLGGAILMDTAGKNGDVAASLDIPADDIPDGAKMLGIFLIPDGGTKNPGLHIGDAITFESEGGAWEAYKGDDELTSYDGNLLFSDRRLNPEGGFDVEKSSSRDNLDQRDSNWDDYLDNFDGDFDDVQFNIQVSSGGTANAAALHTSMSGAPPAGLALAALEHPDQPV